MFTHHENRYIRIARQVFDALIEQHEFQIHHQSTSIESCVVYHKNHVGISLFSMPGKGEYLTCSVGHAGRSMNKHATHVFSFEDFVPLHVYCEWITGENVRCSCVLTDADSDTDSVILDHARQNYELFARHAADLLRGDDTSLTRMRREHLR